MDVPVVTRATYLALLAALAVLAAKLTAFVLTGSVALLSDAAESLVNVAAASAVIYAVRLARRPPDYEHPYGHAKAEYLSGALEGSLILVAAGVILATAVPRLFEPTELRAVPTGLLVATAATAVNGAAGWYLGRVSRQQESPALRATARHLMTDVWTSLGVLVAVGLVALTGVTRLDPIIALLVAINVLREGWAVLVEAMSNLLDVRLPEAEEQLLMDVLDDEPAVRGFHRLRSRQSGFNRFVEVDVFVDPELNVEEAHDVATRLEDRVARRLPNLTATLHIEPFVAGTRDITTTPREEFRPKGEDLGG